MGYESQGYGSFVWRNNANKDIQEELELFGFELNQEDDKVLVIRFNDFRLYHDTNIEMFELILNNLNGELEIQGEIPDDKWKLIFRDGTLFKSNAFFKWAEPVKTSLRESVGAK